MSWPLKFIVGDHGQEKSRVYDREGERERWRKNNNNTQKLYLSAEKSIYHIFIMYGTLFFCCLRRKHSKNRKSHFYVFARI